MTVADANVTSDPPLELDQSLQGVLTRVRLRSQRRIAWLRHLWASEGQSGGGRIITHEEVDAILQDWDHPEAEAVWYAEQSSLHALNQDLADVEAVLSNDQQSRLALLIQIFGLTPPDVDMLHACLAIALNPSLGRVYAYLQDDASHNYVTRLLVDRLFEHGRWLVDQADSALRRWKLVIERTIGPTEPTMVSCDPLIKSWLMGYTDIDSTLVGVANLQPATPSLLGWAIDETVAQVQRLLEQEQTSVCLEVAGVVGSGRRTFAASLCAKLGLFLLTINADAIDDLHWAETWMRAQRQAFLDRCALAWYGKSLSQRAWNTAIAPFPLQIMITEPGQVISLPESSIHHRVDLPLLSLADRRQLWQQYIPTATDWDSEAFEALVTRHSVTVGEIAAIARHLVRSPADAATLLRDTSRHRLGKLAQVLDCPFIWEDLVVTDSVRNTLEDFVFEAQVRSAFWETPNAQRLFPQGRSLMSLFFGSPGTGKTMAAQVIAANLGLDLVRIDLSSVVSKYVGETSQNLDQILTQAAQMDIVLLFDEADALFGKRTDIKDAHDRFANTDTNYLLQAVESYSGVVILATNRKSNIDAAFLRRLRYVVEFPKPDAAQRLTIWSRIVGELAGADSQDALADDLYHLAHQLELTGAQVKFSVLAGLFAAQREGASLAMSHLLRGLERELTKEGRTLSDRDRTRLLNHGR